MGWPAFFVRLYGCPVHCPWCDSAGTWHPAFVPAGIERMTEQEIVAEALSTNANMVIITGGEPTIHDLLPLSQYIQAAGLRAHLETCGAFKLRGQFDWITLSPKKWKHPTPENVNKAHEIKIIVEFPGDIPFYFGMLTEKGFNWTSPGRIQSIWLHPEWSHTKDPAVLRAICNAVKEDQCNYLRAGWQIHKLYSADQRDPRSAKPVPLGGDPSRGY